MVGRLDNDGEDRPFPYYTEAMETDVKISDPWLPPKAGLRNCSSSKAEQKCTVFYLLDQSSFENFLRGAIKNPDTQRLLNLQSCKTEEQANYPFECT